MNHLGTMYATKRRRRNSKSVRVPPKDAQTKSNPSKRHRERLNAELDTLASLLPYEQSVLSKLDKLSILRLSVSYLRTKSYFQCALQREKDNHSSSEHTHKARDLFYPETLMEGDLILQALNGFLLILTCEGEVFYASHTVETYLGFHQSDICHQSVYELVHSEDREELQRHLMWNSHLPTDRSGISLQEGLLPENSSILERNFTVRFRCLLDNTSGFLRLDIRGRIKVLQGQNHKTEEPPMALFAVCTPFGPPSLLEMPQKDSMFKSKHKLDLTLVSMDQRGKHLLGYTDSEMTNRGGYDLVHFDDLAYVASAHQELLKTGASGLIAYRLVTKDIKWQWLQTSARLVYKNSKPDFILCTHRPLIEEEGRDLLGKRTMDFKVTYLDGGLGAVTDRSGIAKWEEEGRDLLGKRTMDFKVTYLDGGLGAVTDRSGLLSDSDFIMRCQRNRRYKTQIRDILTCRNKRPKTSSGPEGNYLDDASAASTYNSVYTYTAENINGLTPYAAAAAAVPQNIFTAIDNTRFLSPDFLHYRHLATGAYYPDYGHHTAPQYGGNGFLDITSAAARTCFTTYPPETGHQLKDDKIYSCQLDTTKFNGDTSRLLPQLSQISQISQLPPPPQMKPSCCEAYDPGASLRSCLMSATSTGNIQPLLPPSLDRESKITAEQITNCRNLNFGHFQTVTSSPNHHHHHNNNHNSPDCVKPKSNNISLSHHRDKDDKSTILMRVTSSSCDNSIVMSNNNSTYSSNDPVTRQSVLMWGNSMSRSNSANSMSGNGGNSNAQKYGSSTPNSVSPSSSSRHDGMTTPTDKTSIELSGNGAGGDSSGVVTSCKWGGSGGNAATTPKSHSPQSSTSPASGKVAPSVSYNANYASEAINEGWHPIEPITTWRPHLHGFTGYLDEKVSFCPSSGPNSVCQGLTN